MPQYTFNPGNSVNTCIQIIPPPIAEEITQCLDDAEKSGSIGKRTSAWLKDEFQRFLGSQTQAGLTALLAKIGELSAPLAKEISDLII